MGTGLDIETITPEMAKVYLATSKGNRILRKHTVEKYARDIANGEWRLNGETIAFSDDGNLINGHHRLNAVLKANTPITTYVVRGITDEANLYDRGITRSTGDNFKFSGEETWMCQNLMIAMAKFCLFINNNLRATDREVYKYMKDNEDAFKVCYELMGIGTGKSKYQRKAPVISAMFYAYRCGVTESVLRRFCKVMNTGFYECESETAAVVFRNWAVENPVGSHEGERRDVFYKAQEAIKAFDSGIPRKRMFTGESGVYSERFKREVI